MHKRFDFALLQNYLQLKDVMIYVGAVKQPNFFAFSLHGGTALP